MPKLFRFSDKQKAADLVSLVLSEVKLKFTGTLDDDVLQKLSNEEQKAIESNSIVISVLKPEKHVMIYHLVDRKLKDQIALEVDAKNGEISAVKTPANQKKYQAFAKKYPQLNKEILSCTEESIEFKKNKENYKQTR